MTNRISKSVPENEPSKIGWSVDFLSILFRFLFFEAEDRFLLLGAGCPSGAEDLLHFIKVVPAAD